jgi:hypothetical protein
VAWLVSWSQGLDRTTHPIAGVAVRPSCRAEFGRCSAIPAIIARGVVLSAQGCSGMASSLRSCVSRDGHPLRPGGVSGACLSLSGKVYLVAFGLSPSFPKGQDGGEVERGYVVCGERRKEWSWRATCLGVLPRPVWPKWDVVARLWLAGLPEQLTIRCLEIPGYLDSDKPALAFSYTVVKIQSHAKQWSHTEAHM